MTIEAAVVIGLDGLPLFWHLPLGRDGVSLPDSAELWSVIWQNRDRIAGVAHSHPGGGIPLPSYTDMTTFDAIEAALGKRLTWWIVSSDHVVECRLLRTPQDKYADGLFEIIQMTEEPPWIAELRRLSEMSKAKELVQWTQS